MRNQAKCIINYYLGDISNPERDGELALIKAVGAGCNTFVDVGANVGHWTELFLRYGNPQAKGILFEPGSSAFAELKRRFGQQAGLQLVNAAVGAEPAIMEFAEESNCGPESSVVAGASTTSSIRHPVPVTTLDIEARRYSFDSIDLLKVDAEGFDFLVLKGATALLRRQAARIIQFEYGAAWAYAGSTLAFALRFLDSMGYRTSLLRESGLFEFNYDRYGEYFGHSNFVAVAPAGEEAIKLLRVGRI